MAARALARACQSNQNAQFTNTVDIFTPGYGGGLELFETMSQVQRDQLMYAARRDVELGGRLLHDAMHSLPAAALQRYPAQCVGLGEVHLPTVELTGGGELFLEVFGGDFGDMIANSSAAGKIQRSLQAIEQCLHIVAHQQGLLQALLQALRADGARACSGLHQMDAAVAQERHRIWLGARSRATGNDGLHGPTGGRAAAPVVAVAMPVNQEPIVVQGLPVGKAEAAHVALRVGA